MASAVAGDCCAERRTDRSCSAWDADRPWVLACADAACNDAFESPSVLPKSFASCAMGALACRESGDVERGFCVLSAWTVVSDVDELSESLPDCLSRGSGEGLDGISGTLSVARSSSGVGTVTASCCDTTVSMESSVWFIVWLLAHVVEFKSVLVYGVVVGG